MNRAPIDWQRTLDTFRGQGLTNAQLAEAGRITKNAKPDDEWAYFCGVCWNMVLDKGGIDRVISEQFK